jgi:L-fuconolactonase
MNTDGAPGAVIDAHHHVWDPSVRAQPWLDQHGLGPLRRNFTIADLEPETAAAGVTATVVVQTVTEPGETPDLLARADPGPGQVVTGDELLRHACNNS